MNRPLGSVLRRTSPLLLAVAAVLAVPAAASAHVTVQPGTIEGGGYSAVSFRVPNERDDASTTEVTVTMPEDQPLASVSTTPVPGWRISTETRRLDEPLELHGSQVTEVVSEVTWTATGRGIAPDQYVDFDVSLGQLPESGRLVFRTLQTYSSGEQVDWNQVAVDDSVEPERPAPVLTLTAPAAGGSGGSDTPSESPSESPSASPTEEPSDPASQSPAADDAEPAGEAAAGEPGDDDEDGATLPLVLSGAALLVALAALALSLRSRRT